MYGSLVYARNPFAGELATTTIAVVTITSGPTRTKVSHMSPVNSSDVTFQADKSFTSYQVRVVPSSSSNVTAGTLLESGSGSWSANSGVTITITDSELTAASAIEGSNILKIFVQNSAGWST